MKRVLLDQNLPVGLAGSLAPHSVELASRRGWAELKNGELLAVAEADGFDVQLTADRNIRYQQNLAGRRLALVVLGTNLSPALRPEAGRIARAIDAAREGSYAELAFAKPPRRRSPTPNGPD